MFFNLLCVYTVMLMVCGLLCSDHSVPLNGLLGIFYNGKILSALALSAVSVDKKSIIYIN